MEIKVRYVAYLAEYLERSPYSVTGSSYSTDPTSVTSEPDITLTTVITSTTTTPRKSLDPTPFGQHMISGHTSTVVIQILCIYTHKPTRLAKIKNK